MFLEQRYFFLLSSSGGSVLLFQFAFISLDYIYKNPHSHVSLDHSHFTHTCDSLVSGKYGEESVLREGGTEQRGLDGNGGSEAG